MAINATAVWEVETVGSDTNGSSFDAAIASAGTDYSQQAVAQLALTDVVTNGTTTITSVTGGFTTQMIANGCYMSGGGASTGTYFITGVASANSATIDRSPGTGIGNTLNVGGAAASPGWAASQMIAGNIMYVKAGTYTVSSASTNVVSGCPSLPATTLTSAITKMVGYTTTRGDQAPTMPLIQANGSIVTFSLVTLGTANYVEGIALDGNNRTSSTGFFQTAAGTFGKLTRCTAINCTNRGFLNTQIHVLCAVSNCSTGVGAFNSSAAYYYGCVAYNNTAVGFALNSGCVATNCYAINNTGSAAIHGFNWAGLANLTNCVAYGNAGSGFIHTTVTTLRSASLENCYAESNGVFGYTANAQTDLDSLINCGAYNNTSGPTSLLNTNNIYNFITLTSTAFNNVAGLDFSLNSNAGGGASLRSAGTPASFLMLSTNNSLDVGAAQHSGGGSLSVLGRILAC